MNYKTQRNVSKLINSVFRAGIPEATQGTIRINDGNIELEINGVFRNLSFSYNGSIFVYNNLPDGYSFKMTNSIISINNFLFKKLKNDNILFKYDGSLEISRAVAYSLNQKPIQLKIEDKTKAELINNSKTNFEDNTLLIFEDIENTDKITIRKGIDDSSIKGLTAHKPLPGGYTGDYNYNPKQKIFMTGSRITKQSKPIGKPASFFKSAKNRLNLESVYKNNLPKRDKSQVKTQFAESVVQPKAIQQKANTQTKTRQRTKPDKKTRTRGGSY
mgnify:FL=1